MWHCQLVFQSRNRYILPCIACYQAYPYSYFSVAMAILILNSVIIWQGTILCRKILMEFFSYIYIEQTDTYIPTVSPHLFFLPNHPYRLLLGECKTKAQVSFSCHSRLH